MATTYDTSVTIGSRDRSGQGFARSIFKRYVEARQKEANRRILGYLQGLDTQTLHRLGYSDAQIDQIMGRKTA